MAAAKTDGERLERVETNIETLTGLVQELTKTVRAIRDDQLVSSATSASKDYVDTKIEATKAAIALDVAAAKRKNTLLVWITGSLSALFGVVLTLLVSFFFNNI